MRTTCPNQLDLHDKGRNVAAIAARKATAGGWGAPVDDLHGIECEDSSFPNAEPALADATGCRRKISSIPAHD